MDGNDRSHRCVSLTVEEKRLLWVDLRHRRWAAANGRFRAGSGRLYWLGISRQAVSERPECDIRLTPTKGAAGTAVPCQLRWRFFLVLVTGH